MDSTERTDPGAGGERGTLAADVTAGITRWDSFDALRREWDVQVSGAFPFPPFNKHTPDTFRVRWHASKARDAVVADFYAEATDGETEGSHAHHLDDRVVVHVIRKSELRFARPRDRGGPTVPAGQFIAWRTSPPWHLGLGPRTTSKMLVLPGAEIGPLIGDRSVVGPADSAEMRVLMAHAQMVGSLLHDLTPGGVQAARDALIELFKGVLAQGLDDNEPRLAPALAQAAMNIVDRRLTDPDLSPSMLSRELNVSVRTLHRAFAAVEESVAGYIRRSRLRQARAELTSSYGRPSISELAARWQFSDSSHFIRAFKQQYGQTPAQYARSGDRTVPGRGSGLIPD
ncbi:helix-turn-helix domain-containing protein [Streptomyces sp. NPDC050287]|uniref:helix-turn-helix domain-containing protein n=1 Tax=Streptomyces sp. NPDC050287 TaxID=3365608 RepID=UPI0037A1776E